MRRWLLLLGGPLFWALHFGAVYAIASISEVAAGDTTSAARLLILAVSVIIGICTVGLLRFSWRLPRAEPLDQFWRLISALGALISLIAIVWQTLPALAPI